MFFDFKRKHSVLPFASHPKPLELANLDRDSFFVTNLSRKLSHHGGCGGITFNAEIQIIFPRLQFINLAIYLNRLLIIIFDGIAGEYKL